MSTTTTHSEVRALEPFTRLVLKDTVNLVELVVERGDQASLAVQAPPEMLVRISSEIKHDTLHISLRSSLAEKLADALTTSLTRKKVVYHLTVGELTHMDLTGLVHLNMDALGDDLPTVKMGPLPPGMPMPPWPPTPLPQTSEEETLESDDQ